MTRGDYQRFFIRVCKDSGYRMEYTKAAIFAGKVLGVSPLEFWIAFGDLKVMEQIAKGDHPACSDLSLTAE